MYIALSKKKDGFNIVDGEKRYYVKKTDIEGLVLGTYKSPNGKPVIILTPFEKQPEEAKQSTL